MRSARPLQKQSWSPVGSRCRRRQPTGWAHFGWALFHGFKRDVTAVRWDGAAVGATPTWVEGDAGGMGLERQASLTLWGRASRAPWRAVVGVLLRISISGWWRGVGTGAGPPSTPSSAGMGRRGGGRGRRLAPLLPFPSVLCPRECSVSAVALCVCVCLSSSRQCQALDGAGPALMATVATWPLPDSLFAKNFSYPCFTMPRALGLGLAWRRRSHPHSPSRGDLPGGTRPSVPTSTGMLQSHQSDVFVLLPTAWPFCWRALPQKSPKGQRCGALLYGISVKPPCNKCHWKELCVVLCRGNRSARGIADQESNL